MCTNKESLSLVECRSFLSALCNVTNSCWHTFIVEERTEDRVGYANSLETKGRLTLPQIIDAAQHAFNSLKNIEISSHERKEILDDLKKSLSYFLDRTEMPGLCAKIKKCWSYVFSKYSPALQIHTLQSSIDEVLSRSEGAEHREESQEAKEILSDSEKRWEKIQPEILALRDDASIHAYVAREKRQIAQWRAVALSLPWIDCQKVSQKLWDLEVRLLDYSQLGFYFVQQRKELKEVHEDIARVKSALKECGDEFGRRLENVRGYKDYFFLNWWIASYPLGLVEHLKGNRFFKVSGRDAGTSEAVQASQEIAECIQLAEELAEIFRLQLQSHDGGDLGIQDFQKLMEKMEKDLLLAKEYAEGDQVLVDMCSRLEKASRQNKPEIGLYSPCKELPDTYEKFKTEMRHLVSCVHPDKHRDSSNHIKAAELLFCITKRAISWVASKKYNQR